MSLSEGQQTILDILAEKSNHNPGMSVYDTAIIKESGLLAKEVNTYLDQLHRLGLIILEFLYKRNPSITGILISNITRS